MSGGHFDHQQYIITNIALEIKELIASNDSTEKDDLGYEVGQHFPPDIIAKFKEAKDLLNKTARMVQRIDWLVSGDDGEESFRKRWEEELGEY